MSFLSELRTDGLMMIEPRTKRLTKMMSMRQSRRQKEPENEAVTIPPPLFVSHKGDPANLQRGTLPSFQKVNPIPGQRSQFSARARTLFHVSTKGKGREAERT